MKHFFREMWWAAKQGPRIYFAPIRGLIAGISKEWELLEEGQNADAKNASRAKPLA